MQRPSVLALALVLVAGCAVQRPVAQPLAEARYYHAEDALSDASDKIASIILARMPGRGPIVVALPPVFQERQIRLFRSFLYAGLAAGRDIRLLPFAKAMATTKLPVVEIVLLAEGSELLADKPPPNAVAASTLHISALVRVHEQGRLLWSDILHAQERELPLPRHEASETP